MRQGTSAGTEIAIEGSIGHGRAEIKVINYGIRLYSEEVEKVFEDGHRGKEANKRYPTGTGIGLTVTRQIIELHKGKLTVRPSEHTDSGWRTIFTIGLPVYSRENEE